MFQYDPSSSLEDNHSHMTTALESVKSGSVTFAVRDTKIDGVEIKKAIHGIVRKQNCYKQ